MDLSGQKSPLTDLSLSDLRQLGRDEIAELVTAGLLEADRAAEIQSEDFQHKQDEQQVNAAQRVQAQQKSAEQKQDADWLQHMSQSYQQTYHQLMDTYDTAGRKYGTIKTDAEKLKDGLRQKVEAAYRFGINLPDGTVAFYDRKNSSFVDGATLQPLKNADTDAAAEAFKKLSPKQQNANVCYMDACHAYNDADGISHTADDASRTVGSDKSKLEASQGTISEAELTETKKTTAAQVAALSAHLDDVKNENADLDAALSADADDVDAPQKTTAQTASFASQIDTNAKPIGAGNGKTSVVFNSAATQADADNSTVSAPAVIPVSPPTPDYNRIQGFSK